MLSLVAVGQAAPGSGFWESGCCARGEAGPPKASGTSGSGAVEIVAPPARMSSLSLSSVQALLRWPRTFFAPRQYGSTGGFISPKLSWFLPLACFSSILRFRFMRCAFLFSPIFCRIRPSTSQ